MNFLLARTVHLKRFNALYKGLYDASNRAFTSNPSRALFSKQSRGLFGVFKLKPIQRSWCPLWVRLFHVSSQSKLPLTSSNPKEMSSMEIIKRLFQFIWPKKNARIKTRVVVAMALLIGSKLLNVTVPFLFKEIIDFLNNNSKIKDFGESAQDKVIMMVVALVVGYGAARAGASLFGELRSAIFATVAQSSVTKLATNVFRHLHQLDLNFHLNRQTGALSKAIDRGTRGISFIQSALVFNIVPTLVEVVLVSGILYSQFGVKYALVSVGCIGGYAAFTFAITQWRQKYRQDMNSADNQAGNKAIDSLINYETVKYFNNDEYEVKRYHESLKKYEAAAIKTSTSLAVLNFGQNAIFSTGLTAIMVCQILFSYHQ